jgi:hypothetical protein
LDDDTVCGNDHDDRIYGGKGADDLGGEQATGDTVYKCE